MELGTQLDAAIPEAEDASSRSKLPSQRLRVTVGDVVAIGLVAAVRFIGGRRGFEQIGTGAVDLGLLPKIGQPAPDFVTLAAAEGQPVPLSDYRGKYERLHPRGLDLLAVSLNEPAEDAAAFAALDKTTFTTLWRLAFGFAAGWLAVPLMAALRLLQTMMPVARRQFLRNAALGAVGSALTLVGAATGLLLWPNKTGAFGSEITVRAEVVPAVNAPPYRHTAGHFYLAHPEDGLLALWWKCPHLGCTVPWVGPPESPNAYQCPCHGSMYDYNGVRTGGPAPRPMDLMRVTVAEDGSVRIDTGQITTRTDYTAEQAVPYPA